MDRDLRILKNGHPFANFSFNYSNSTSGRVKVAIYSVVDLGDDMVATTPLFSFEDNFDHKPLASIEAVKQFDQGFVKQYDNYEKFDGDLEFIYDEVNYRYVVNDHALMGILEVQANFNENKKELKFISARRIKEDVTVNSDCLTINTEAFKQYWAEYMYPGRPGEFIRLGWH